MSATRPARRHLLLPVVHDRLQRSLKTIFTNVRKCAERTPAPVVGINMEGPISVWRVGAQAAENVRKPDIDEITRAQ